MPTEDTLVTAADRMNPLMTAADIMTADPRTCSTFSTVLEAVLIFRDADCGFVPILEDGKPAGVLTDRDIALALIDHGADLPSRTVTEIMRRSIVTVPADATLDVIEGVLADHRVRRVLVVDSEDRLLGVISWSDLSSHVSTGGLGGLVHQVMGAPRPLAQH